MNDSRQKRSIRQKTTSKASLFLMEMMIGIVFFAIAATGCVQVFARAHLLSQEAEDLQMAQSLAAEAVEELRADTELWESLAEAGEMAAQESSDMDALARDYDESWGLCEDTAEAEYHLTAVVSAKQTAINEETRQNVRLGHIRVSVTDSDGAELYALETDQAIPYTLADAETEH